jgi:Sulfatase
MFDLSHDVAITFVALAARNDLELRQRTIIYPPTFVIDSVAGWPLLPTSTPMTPYSTWKRLLQGTVALVVLNAFLSMTNLWPTPFVQLDKRIAPEFVLWWVIILLIVWSRGALSRRATVALTLGYMLLVTGRYFDTTAPALFGRNINLYWDALQIPRVVWVSLKSYPAWVSLMIVVALVAFIWLVYRVLRACITVAAREAAPYTLKNKWALAVTLAAVALVSANVYGIRETWPYVSKPAIPTYLRQATLLSTAFAERDLQKTLPPSPAFDSDLGALRGLDVNLFFLESYGMMAFSNSEVYAQLKPSRDALAEQIKASGMQVVSAYVNSTTFGGGSELAHVALLSGIDTGDPMRHDLLLTTNRPTLVSMFRARGYETFGFYPALTWDWPEKSFYGFDKFTDARDLDYKGPKLGFWTMPDQFSLARYSQLHPITAQSPKRFTFFTSITSHMPFHPVPPYQKDWQKVLSNTPFDEAQMAKVHVQKEDWFNMRPGYIGMLDYNYQWLAGYLAQPKARESVYVLLGDHQPAANVTGEGAAWDVPVHIVSAQPELLQRFIGRGFKLGLEPTEPRIGGIFDLTRVLNDAFDSGASKTTAAPSATTVPANAVHPTTLVADKP